MLIKGADLLEKSSVCRGTGCSRIRYYSTASLQFENSEVETLEFEHLEFENSDFENSEFKNSEFENLEFEHSE